MQTFLVLAQVNAILESKRKEVLSSRGLDEEEEETAMAQLGIRSKVDANAKNVIKRESKADDTKEGSLVAQVIEANTLPKSENQAGFEVNDDGLSATDVIHSAPRP